MVLGLLQFFSFVAIPLPEYKLRGLSHTVIFEYRLILPGNGKG
jgi:hypothetical protein